MATSNMETKKCTGCGEEKLLIEFSKRAASKDGYQPMCKCCVGLYKKDYYKKNKDDISNKAKSRRKEYGDDIRAAEKRRRDGNRDTYNAIRKVYRDRNADKVRAAKQRAYLRNREAILKKNKEYRDANKTAASARAKRYRESNKQAVAAQKKKWKDSNRDKSNAKTMARNAAKLQATPVWCNQESIIDFYSIARAFRIYTGDEYHVDHIVPLKSDIVCGLHCEANLQVLLASENISKGNRHWPDMW